MTNPDMMTNMVKQGIGGFLPQAPLNPFPWMLPCASAHRGHCSHSTTLCTCSQSQPVIATSRNRCCSLWSCLHCSVEQPSASLTG